MKALTLTHDTAQVRDLNDMREFLEKAILALGGSDDDAGDLVLAVNEAITNVLLHGYGGQPGPIWLRVEAADDDLRVVLSDNAPPFDPTQVPPPDIYLPLEDRPLGGLGIHMMRQLTDELVYHQAAEGNELTFVKRGALARVKA
jgi:serine/threonine-protein kinase RsbW